VITFSFKLPRKNTGSAVVAETKSFEPYPPQAEKDKPPPWWATAFKGGIGAKRLGKLEYALYLKNMPYKKGDILVSKHHLDGDMIKDEPMHIYMEVIDVQEMHNHVEYVGTDVKCLWMRGVDRRGPGFWSCPTWYEKVTEDNMPPTLRRFLEKGKDDPALI
jgi:hypothetical protein